MAPRRLSAQHGIRSERWRFIRHAGGSEDLYDTQSDPKEWTNLAGDPYSATILEDYRRWLPETNLPLTPGNAPPILACDPVTREAVWEGKNNSAETVEWVMNSAGI